MGTFTANKFRIHISIRGLIVLRQHDRDHAPGNRRVGWIRRVVCERPVKIVDLEKDRLAVGFERSKFMLFVRVVGTTEVTEHRDGLDDPVDGDLAERRPGVMTVMPPGRCCRSSSLRARMRAVLVSMTKLRSVFRSAKAMAQAGALRPEPQQIARLTGQA